MFCCFSNTYKITEEVFDAWIAILQRTGGTVLWLYADNETAQRNMARRFAAAGLDADRLVFAARNHPEVYRARLALADLFLDTFPYNAGTTASDALRVGLPIVTIAGRSFISRMAGSLLHAVGLDEGVVGSLDAYVDLAVDSRARSGALCRLPGRRVGQRLGADARRHTRLHARVRGGIGERGDPAGSAAGVGRRICERWPPADALLGLGPSPIVGSARPDRLPSVGPGSLTDRMPPVTREHE